jgi:phosphorylcholine metabolism protein LicD
MKLYVWDKEKNYCSCHDKLAYIDIPHEIVHVDILTLVGAPKGIKSQKFYTSLCYYSYEILRCKHVNIQYSKPNHRIIIGTIKFFLKVIPDYLIRIWYYFLKHRYDLDKSQYAYTVSSGYRMRECLPKEIYLNSIRVPFEDLILPIPKEYDTYLTSVYGDYMTPKKDGYKLIQ